MTGKIPGHLPVMVHEAVEALRPADGTTFVDATFGGGGYAQALLQAADCRVVAIDQDPQAVARGHALAAREPRFSMLEGRFGDLAELLASCGIDRVDGIVADLGLSSFQLDDPDRGFGFARPGPLDMRMGGEGATAADLLASLPERELARIFRLYGDEPRAGRIARAIVARRASAPLTRTEELRALAAAAKGGRPGPRDPATLVFQALRIAVNDELGELERLLEAAREVLRPGGRLAIVTFHSGEDRIVKRFIDEAGGRPRARSRHLPPLAPTPPEFAWVERGVRRPGEAELAANPRARSAKLRVAVRLGDADAEAEDGGIPAGGWKRAA
jgi:16S rRNA (cytosine1402-N4)-methyltransferase